MDETPQTTIRLETITNRINRLLQDKYNLRDSQDDRKNEYVSQRDAIPKDSLLQAYEKTERMSIKLQQIRTLLGYDQQLSKEKKQPKNSSQKKKDEKATNLKNFVLSMRKKNQTIKQGQKIGTLFTKDIKSLGTGDPNIQQYTDASLKYINSFLPHQTFVDYQVNRQRKTFSENTNKQSLKKSNELKPEELKELQQMQSKLIESSQKKLQISPVRDANAKNTNQIFFSPIVPKFQSSTHSFENTCTKNISGYYSQKSKIECVSKYFTINVDSPRDSYVKQKESQKRMASPLGFLAGKTIQYTHKSKAKCPKPKRCWDNSSAKPQTRETIKRIVPIILPCIPKQRELC